MPPTPQRRVLIPAIVGVAFFMHGLDITIVTTALPHMAESFAVNPVRLGIIVIAYTLSMAVFVPVSGWLADRFGDGFTFAAAIAIFSLGSLLCGLSNGVAMLTTARIMQGVGAALIIPVGRLVVLHNIPKFDYIRALVIVGLFPTVGIMMGPPVGGFITTFASWRWVFLFNIPVGVLGVVLVLTCVENVRAAERRPMDWTGFVLTGLAVSTILYGFEGVSRAGGDLPWMVALLAFGLVVGLLAVRHALRKPDALLDLSLLRIETLRKNVTGGSLFRIAAGGLPFLLPLLFQVVFGMTPLQSGGLTLAIGAGVLAARLIVVRAIRAFGFRSGLVAAMGICIGGQVLCALLTGSTPAFLVMPLLFVIGFAQGFLYTALNTLAAADVPQARLSAGTSLSQTFQQLAQAAAVAVAASLLHIGLLLRGAETLAKADFVLAFLALAVVQLFALWSFWRMTPTSGDEMRTR